jgi:hypothetical protein
MKNENSNTKSSECASRTWRTELVARDEAFKSGRLAGLPSTGRKPRHTGIVETRPGLTVFEHS